MGSHDILHPIPQGSRIGTYQLIRVLGSGAMGVVYEANAHDGRGRVALKVVGDGSGKSAYRLKREFRALSGIVHPNLVTLYDLFVEAERAYFTMELVEGTGFLEYVHAADVPWRERPARLLEALKQLAEGVAALHRARTIHRDIKPSNVLVTRAGRVVLLDFGLATPVGAEALGFRRSDYALAGTLGYLAPELFANHRRLTTASDWYSVGVVLFEALTGLTPPVGHPPDLRREGTYWHRADGGDATIEELVSVCTGLLRADPRERLDAGEVLERLGRLAVVPRKCNVSVAPARLPLPFVGRRPELMALADAFEAMGTESRPITVYVRGPSGSGKTTLVRRFLEQLSASAGPSASAPVVLASGCYEREVVPYQACDGLVDALTRYLRDLPELECVGLLPRRSRDLARTFPVLDRVDAIRKAPQREGGDREVPEHERQRRSVQALKELLGRIGDKVPMVIWLDDLQWGDADSARLLADLQSPPDAPPLLLIGSYRSDDAARSSMLRALEEAGAFDAGRAKSDVRHIDLGPLPPDDARALACSVLEADARDQLSERIATEAQGHAYLVVALAHHLRNRPPSRTGEQAPASLSALVREQLAGLAPRSRALVELVAVVGRPIDAMSLVKALDQLEGPSAQDVRAAKQTLVAQNLLRAVRVRDRAAFETYHDRVREIAAGDAPPERLRRLHLALARSLQSASDLDAEQVARHLHAAERPEEAVHYALAAAEGASREMAFQHAADLYQLARDSLEDRVDTGLLRKHADALANAGRCADAAPLYVLAASRAAPPEVFELQRLGVEMYLLSGGWTEGVAILRPMVERAGLRFPNSRLAAGLAFLVERARLAARGLAFRERDAPAPDELLQRVDVCVSVVKCMAVFEPIISGAFLLEALRLALDAGDPRRGCHTLAIYLAVEASFGTTHEEQEPRWQVAVDLARRSGDESLIAITDLLQGVALLNCGRWRSAFERMSAADRALRCSRRGLPWDIGGRLSFLRIALYFTGDLDRVVSLAAAHRQETKQRGDVLEYASALLHESYGNLRANDSSKAREAVATAMAHFPMPSVGESHMWPGVYLLAHCDFYDGDAASAGDRLRRAWPALRRSGVLRSMVWGTQFEVLRAQAVLSGADASVGKRSVERLARRLMRASHRWMWPFGDVLNASLLRTARAPGACEAMDRAVQGFEREGMLLYAACARRRRGELLGGGDGAVLIAAADGFMRAQGISSPERWTAMYVPPLTPADWTSTQS